MESYCAKEFSLPSMEGLSEKQIDIHLGLYAGYVKNVNALIQLKNELARDPEKNSLALAEITRRYAFEWNGMRMHEYYFEILGGDGAEKGEIIPLIEKNFSSFEHWKKDFERMGAMRGIGWVILAQDKRTEKLFNIWVNDHEIGQLAGAHVIIAMDVWEHAYLIDYLPSERNRYIQAFFANLSWEKINKRLKSS